MNEETNDMIPGDPGKDLPSSIREHLRTIMADRDLGQFREQLPPGFLLDASEGLDQLNDPKQLESVLQQLNKEMNQHLTHIKTKRLKRSIGNLNWTYWAVIIIILLTVISFVVIRMHLKNA
jgi:hypothetical protein